MWIAAEQDGWRKKTVLEGQTRRAAPIPHEPVNNPELEAVGQTEERGTGQDKVYLVFTEERRNDLVLDER